MKTASSFLELEERRRLVPVWFEGGELQLPEGSNLAAAMLAAGVGTFRYTPVSGAPRAPFCMMGACFDCLVDVDGVTRQACMLEVTEGLRLSMPRKGRNVIDADN
ncbi:(2Fe-2S)-binding protein [Ruegeria sp. SCP11]|uniref:(2Fe-2S)-binding protein n=1 Tax=Ruegeria sp. SCP11 TaxID=3141378 RepID=UPI001480FF1A